MMRDLICGVVALAVLSGCLGGVPGLSGENYWQVGIGGSLSDEGSEYVFEGSVGLGGNYGAVEVTGLRIEFVDKSNNTVKSVSIGTLNQSRPRAAFDVTVARPPHLVVPVAERIDSPPNLEYTITGLKRTENGEYDEYNPEDSRP